MIVKALTIGGSDTSSGAGIQSDLAVFSTLKVYGVSVITSITSQNTQRIIDIHPLPKDTIRKQLDALYEDLDLIKAIKIGMVYDEGIIYTLYDYLKDSKTPIIIDPVLRSTTNTRLLKQEAHDAYKQLLKLAYVITPNILEAEVLADMKIDSIDDAKEAARRLSSDGIKNIIITGGHFRDKAVDLLYTDEFYEISNDKIANEFHGAGTIFAATLTAEIAKGFVLIDAFKLANRYTRYALENSYKIGKGLLIPSLMHYIDDDLLELQRAVDLLETMPDFDTLIPETQTNFVYAKDNNDIIGVKGRIVKFGNKVRAGYVARNASRHVASALKSAMRYASVRSAINIRYDERLIKIAEGLGMKVSS